MSRRGEAKVPTFGDGTAAHIPFSRAVLAGIGVHYTRTDNRYIVLEMTNIAIRPDM
jgi:hypothetical protein